MTDCAKCRRGPVWAKARLEVRHWPRAQPLGHALSLEVYVHTPVPGLQAPGLVKVRREPATQVGAGAVVHLTLIA